MYIHEPPTREEAIKEANDMADERGGEWVVTTNNSCYPDYYIELNKQLIWKIVYSSHDRDEELYRSQWLKKIKSTKPCRV